jgi:hypothetical protein
MSRISHNGQTFVNKKLPPLLLAMQAQLLIYRQLLLALASLQASHEQRVDQKQTQDCMQPEIPQRERVMKHTARISFHCYICVEYRHSLKRNSWLRKNTLPKKSPSSSRVVHNVLMQQKETPTRGGTTAPPFPYEPTTRLVVWRS